MSKDYDLPNEEWRVIPGVLEYEVSSVGRVRRLTSRTHGKAGHIIKNSQRGKTGHVTVQIWSNGIAKTTTVSRLIALAFHGRPPTPQHQAAHNDSNPRNNVVSNIRWATGAENAGDRIGNGTDPSGERHPMAVLDEEKVMSIRRQRAEGMTLMALGKAYGVNLGTIWLIVNRKTWRHVS